jgi:malate dehydrogenase (oxaloacetate-decarboxylating)
MDSNRFLYSPLVNKGTAFTFEERDRYKLHGLLPYHVSTIQEQVQRRYENFKVQPSDLAKHLFLSSLLNRNQVLFYKLVSENITEMLPYIYTPTVGDVSVHYSLLYTDPQGVYFSYPLQDKIEEIVDNIPADLIDIAVITDGERILGLGDLGAGGMTIPVGKLTLYTLFGGINPGRTLPIMLDVGTNNPVLLNDPLYLGWRHPRVSDEAYYLFIDRVINGIKKRFPSILLQWEDFAGRHAKVLLDKYRHQICCFNDDIQGTACVVLAALLAAIKKNQLELQEQRIVIFGGGAAGIGIAHHLVGAMKASGIDERKAFRTIYIVDVHGLVYENLSDVTPFQKPFARLQEEVVQWKISTQGPITLLDVVENAHPTILIGVSAQYGGFTEKIVTTMARYVEFPIIFPLSNPTSKAEACPADLIEWTCGKAIIATGSPFKPVSYKGKLFSIAQCNNVYVFPGIGLGVLACGAKEVSDGMFFKAAEILSLYSPMLRVPEGGLFPPFENLPNISQQIALGVIEIAQTQKIASLYQKGEDLIDNIWWSPDYV